MDISIIIVNWNSAEYVRKCLESIYAETQGIDFEVIVVDNASYDGCAEMLNVSFPMVKFIQNKTNSGFACANNMGFGSSTGQSLLFLNPDTEILCSAINVMHFYLQSLPDAGCVGCRLLNTDLSLQTSCIQPFPTILNQIFGIEYLKLRFPEFKLWGIKPLFFNNGAPQKVEVVSGACMMINRNVFETIGMFSTDYFMYSEDVDLCYKIQQAGYKVYYVNDCVVVHHGGTSSKHTKVNNLNNVLIRESRLKYFKKTSGRLTAILYRFLIGVASIVRLIILLIITPIAILLHRTDLLYPKLIKWKNILRWALGREKWARELNGNIKSDIF